MCEREGEKNLGVDIQESEPATRVSLSRVGVTGLKRVLRLRGSGRRRSTLFFAEMDMFAHLASERSGVHMSRFIENIEAIASMMATESSPDIETLAERMAMAIAETQGTKRAEVRVRAQFPMTKRAPVSGASVEDLYTFIGIAVSDGFAARRAIGVEAMGLTVCPCAREMVSEYTRAALMSAGYSEAQAAEITSIAPLASHNQRGKGTLVIGTQTALSAENLVSVVLDAMSSEIYELLKRPDELHVVRKAHSRPRFVEDVVREMISGAARRFAELPDDAFVMARQENFESIHIHSASAERCGLLCDMRRELSGDGGPARSSFSSLEAWLDSLL
jgi:GTP cyclohydrolase-4